MVANDQTGRRGDTVEHDYSWVVPLRSYGVKPPLFCASALGGDAFDYRDLALALPEDQPVYSLKCQVSVRLRSFRQSSTLPRPMF